MLTLPSVRAGFAACAAGTLISAGCPQPCWSSGVASACPNPLQFLILMLHAHPRVRQGGPQRPLCLGAGEKGIWGLGLLSCSEGCRSCSWLRRGKSKPSSLDMHSQLPTSGEPGGGQPRGYSALGAGAHLREVGVRIVPSVFLLKMFFVSLCSLVSGSCPLQMQTQSWDGAWAGGLCLYLQFNQAPPL